MKSLLIAAFITALSVTTASAQINRTHHVDRRRIHQGVENGQLTGREAARLHHQKSNLRAEAFRYKNNDGHIGRFERADLARDNARLNRNIYHQKHDLQRRF